MTPKFANTKPNEQQALMDRIFNDMLMDLKLANHVIKKDDPERAEWVMAAIIHEANLTQVS